MEIIGLSGFAQSGKDTAGKYLCDKYGYMRVSFADAVRDGLYALNPLICITPEESKEFDGMMGILRLELMVNRFGYEQAKKCKEVRQLLQRYGTEAGREIHGNQCWTNIGLRKAAKYPKVVFTDVRFENEVEAVKSIGGTVIRIKRNGVGAVNGHISDKPLPGHLIDIELDNSGTLLDLHENLDNLLQKSIIEAVTA